MKNNIKDYFYFSRSERSSAIWLASITLSLFFLPRLYDYLFSHKDNSSSVEYQNIILGKPNRESPQSTLFEFDPNTANSDEFSRLGLSEKLIKTILRYRSKGGKFKSAKDFRKIWGLSEKQYAKLEPFIAIKSAEKKDGNSKNPAALNIQKFPFDPNTATFDSLILVGIPSKIASQIINYRSKGGKFREKADLKKIYHFPEDLYVNLEAFIKIYAPARENPSIKTLYKSRKVFQGLIEINSASYEKWVELPGIGPTLASKIVRFREKLGGFYSIEQVKETYGLQDSMFQKIKSHLIIQQGIQMINVNTVSLEVLSAHPYCKYHFAKIILNYRDAHQGIRGEADMLKIYGIKDILPKLLPYLTY